MIRIDDSLLEELGLITLPKDERDALLSQIYDTLEMRVGMKLAERMTDQQLDEFEAFLPNEQTGSPGDEAGALRWLETNFPDYKQVVADELEKLKGEIKRDSQQILQSSRAAAASANQPVSSVPPVRQEQLHPPTQAQSYQQQSADGISPRQMNGGVSDEPIQIQRSSQSPYDHN